MTALFIIMYLIFPAMVIYLTLKYKIFRNIGAVLLCYLAGMILGNSGILPQSITPLQVSLSEAAVALSLPLLLFSLDVKKWFKIAGKAMISMTMALVAVVSVSTFAFFTLKNNGMENAHQLAGMATGVYSGGTPNLAAIKSALNIDSSTYLLFHTYDTVFSLIYIFLIVSVGQRFFHTFLPKFNHAAHKIMSTDSEETESIDDYRGLFRFAVLLPLLAAVGLSGLIIVLSLKFSSLFPVEQSSAVTILSITTLSIAASFIPAVRNIKKTFPVGMYIIYIFCFVVASMTDLKSMVHIDYTILIFVFVSIFGSMALHALFSKFLKIDADTFLVTSVSAICSPPFVPVVAGALKNPAVLLSGITTGIIGYALGNYLGISLALLLQQLP
jgi:uncharacterized membrane protein